CTTLSAVAVHPEIAAHYPALATAAGLVSSPQLRNMGTIGGNVCVDTRCNYYNQSYEWRKAVGFCMKRDGAICLVAPRSPRCWAVSSSDTAPVLWSLGARVRLRSAAGERTIPVETLFRDDGIEYLAKRPDEILTDILLPPADGWRSAYLKLRRRGSFDFPVLGVAVAVQMEGDVVRDARIVVGAGASRACAPSASCSSASSRRRRTSRRAWCRRSSRGGSRRRSIRSAGSRRRSACRSAPCSTASPPARSSCPAGRTIPSSASTARRNAGRCWAPGS